MTRPTLQRAMTEDELLQAIVEAATYRGWLVHHVRRSDKALQQGHAGFPDLVLAKQDRTPLFLELKSETGRATDAQQDWWRALGGRYQLVRPRYLDKVLRWLE